MKLDLRPAVLSAVLLTAALVSGCTFAPPVPAPDAVAPPPPVVSTAPAAAERPAATEAPASTDTVGRLEIVTLTAASLRGNLLNDPIERPLAIYLPPTYFASNARYPVVYFLTGFGDQVTDFVSGVYGFALPLAMDSLILRQRAREMIFVVVSGRNALGGSFYVNSPVTGGWEDFVVQDVVRYVDSHYRTVAHPSSRGICGHSMGGSGALDLAMKHPDVFGAVYSLSPGLFAEDGLSQSQMFASQVIIDSFVALQTRLAAMPRDQAKTEFGNVLKAAAKRSDWTYFFTCAYGAAFAPDPKKNPPYLAYPYRKEGGQTVRDPEVWAKWDGGFGGLAEKVEQRHKSLLRLKTIIVEYGTEDEYRWIPQGCQHFSHLLDAAGVPHRLISFPGGHQDKLGERMQEYMIPFLSDVLASGARGIVEDIGGD